MTQSCDLLLRIQKKMTEFLHRVNLPRSRRMKHESTHIRFQPWCTSCVKSKTQTEPHRRIERITEDSELPIVQCDHLLLKNVRASDGLQVLSMHVKNDWVRRIHSC